MTERDNGIEHLDFEVPVEQPSRLRRVGKWIIDALAASSGHGIARMGMLPPLKQPEITDENEERQ